MRFFYFILNLLIITPSFADWQIDCALQGEDYGNHKFIDKVCQKEIIENASVVKKDKDYTLYAWKNILFLKGLTETYIVSGDKSLLKEIIAVDVEIEKNRILVLNDVGSKKQVLLFKAKRSGNITPFRLIEGKEINELNSVSFSEEIFIGIAPIKTYRWDFLKDSRSVGLISPLE